MFKLWMIQTLLSLLILLDQAIAQTPRNITVDDTDPMISYAGTWDPSSSHLSTKDNGGSHTLSIDAAASATFTFTGVAVYYLSPKWPYTVDSYVSLDGGAPVFVNMTAPPQDSPNGEETVQFAPLWAATGLSSGPHRVVVTKGPSGYAVVDGFIYTTQSTDTPTSQFVSTVVSTTTVRTNQETSSTTSGASASSTSSNNANSTVIIAVTISASVACFIILVILVVFFMRRKKNTDAEYRNSTAFGPSGGRETTYTIPGREANTYSTYSAVPLTENHTYPYPYPSHNVGSGMAGMEMGRRDSRYSAMGHSDSTTIGSASGVGSLSAQQQMSYANVPYGQDAYGLYPVSNRALVVPAGGAAYNTRGSGNGTDWYNASAPVNGGGYHGGDYSGGHNVAEAYAGVGSSAAVNPPNQPPSPLSTRSRFEGSYLPYADGSNDAEAAYSGYAASTSTIAAVPLAPPARQVSPVPEKARYNTVTAGGYKNAHPYNAAGPISPSEPPPSYAARADGSSSRPTPSSPPRPNKQGFI